MATPALVVRFYIKNFSTNYLPIFGQVRYLSDNFLSGKPNSGCVLACTTRKSPKSDNYSTVVSVLLVVSVFFPRKKIGNYSTCPEIGQLRIGELRYNGCTTTPGPGSRLFCKSFSRTCFDSST